MQHDTAARRRRSNQAKTLLQNTKTTTLPKRKRHNNQNRRRKKTKVSPEKIATSIRVRVRVLFRLFCFGTLILVVHVTGLIS
jgi:hypothetical protein